MWTVYVNLKQNFYKLIIPKTNLYTRDITGNESLLLCKSRLDWVHYIPLERAIFGIKTCTMLNQRVGMYGTQQLSKLVGKDFQKTSSIIAKNVTGDYQSIFLIQIGNNGQLSQFGLDTVPYFSKTDVYGTTKLKLL